MKSIKQLMCVGLMGWVGAVTGVAQTADTVVPSLWNTPTWTDGSKLEQFSTLPSWATGEALVPGSVRADTRFWSATDPETALGFATLGMTNTISAAKIQVGAPLFVDMRCKINPFEVTPPVIESNTLLCFYANEKSNLVVASSSECKTNTAVTISPDTYYSIMIRFGIDTFDVFFDNATEPTLFLTATTNEISKMVVSGAGEMDDLYMSFGDPMRKSGSSGITLGGWTPSGDEEVAIANWLANKTTSGTYTKANAEKFYLTDTTPTGETFTGQLGIGSFSYDPTTRKVSVAVTLTTDANTKKTGSINGILRLKGAATYADAKGGNWSSVLEAVKIGADDFNNGVATYTFTLQDDTYKFFLPVIVSDIK